MMLIRHLALTLRLCGHRMNKINFLKLIDYMGTIIKRFQNVWEQKPIIRFDAIGINY